MTNKIRKSFIIKIDQRNEKTQKRVSKWLDAQRNYSASIISIIQHTIERFGYIDVMSHEITKKLHKEKLIFEEEKSIQSELTSNVNFPIHDSQIDKIFIEIQPQNRILLISDEEETTKISYKF